MYVLHGLHHLSQIGRGQKSLTGTAYEVADDQNPIPLQRASIQDHKITANQKTCDMASSLEGFYVCFLSKVSSMHAIVEPLYLDYLYRGNSVQRTPFMVPIYNISGIISSL